MYKYNTVSINLKKFLLNNENIKVRLAMMR